MAAEPFRESSLKEFFEGQLGARELGNRLSRCQERLDPIHGKVHIVRDLKSEYRLTREHMLGLCQAALAGELPPSALETVAFILFASDLYDWDADRDPVLAEVILDWSAPTINYSFTTENLERFKKWLLGTEPYPEPSGKTVSDGGNLLKHCEAVFHDP